MVPAGKLRCDLVLGEVETLGGTLCMAPAVDFAGEVKFYVAWDDSTINNARNIGPAETDEQSAFVSKARRCGFWCHSVPNGGFREVETASKFKREGMSLGAPDLIVWGQGDNIDLPIVGMEFKKNNGLLSDFSENQVSWLTFIQSRISTRAFGVMGHKPAVAVMKYLGYDMKKA